MFLSSCGKKGDPYTPYVPPSVLENLENTIENEGTISAGGNNEAYSFSPCEGVEIDVPKDALYEDTIISMDRVTEDTPGIQKIINDLYDENVYAIGAWEIDAGLENDECLPGSYKVSIDLEKLEIDESLYDFVKIVRINDNGEKTILRSNIEGKVLNYSSNRNSIIVAVLIGFGFFPVAWYIHDEVAAEWYYEKHLYSGERIWVASFESKDYSFDVQYLIKDLDPDLQKKIDRCAEINEKYLKQIREGTTSEKQSSWDVFGLFSRNASEAELLKKALKKDAEYQRLQAQISRPTLLDGIILKILAAFIYLKKQNIKMPEEAVQFYLRPDVTQLGNSVWTLFGQSHIEISLAEAGIMNSNTVDGKKELDNLLLTITHELFHVCQTYYHTHLFTDSIRFDEMMAVALESEARDYYYEQGLIKTKPALTDQDHWQELESSINSFDLNDLDMRHQGYNLSLLIPYLRKATGKKDVTIGDIMNARSYWKKPNTTEPLCKAFDIKEEDFSKYWYGFCKENAERAVINNMDKNSIGRGKKKDSMIQTKGDYSLKIKGFFQTEKQPLPLLIVFDEPAVLNDQRLSIFPAGEYSNFKKGFYIPAQKSDEDAMKNPRRWIIESFGKQNGETVLGTYTVWGMDKTSKVDIDVSYISDKLFIYMTKVSDLATYGLIDGYYIKLETDNGVKMEGHRKADDLIKGLAVPFAKLYNGDKTKDVKITVTACEYVLDNNGNYLYGITSDPSIYKLNGVPETEEDETPMQEDTQEDTTETTQTNNEFNNIIYGYPLEMYCSEAIYPEGSSGPLGQIVSKLKGTALSIAGDGSFTISLPTDSASVETHKGTVDKYIDSTMSFTFKGKMVPLQILYPEDYAEYGWDKCEIDYGEPVYESAEIYIKTTTHEKGIFNTSYHYTKDKVTEARGDQAKIDEAHVYFESGSHIDAMEGLDENGYYLVMILEIRFIGKHDTIEDEWREKTATMNERKTHDEYNDVKDERRVYLKYISFKPVSEYSRECSGF